MTTGCPYCCAGMRGKRNAPTRDHINPKSRGGGPSIKVCAACNNFKADMPVLVWLEWLEANRPSRLRTVVRMYYNKQILRFVSDDELMPLATFMRRVSSAQP